MMALESNVVETESKVNSNGLLCKNNNKTLKPNGEEKNSVSNGSGMLTDGFKSSTTSSESPSSIDSGSDSGDNLEEAVSVQANSMVNGHVDKEPSFSSVNGVVLEQQQQPSSANSVVCRNGSQDESSIKSEEEESSSGGGGGGGHAVVEDLKDHDILLIQDAGFTVQIVPPGVEPFEIQVNCMELVQEIHQLLLDREDTCHRTCFSLQLNGVTLDNFAELKNVEGLKEGSVIKVVEEPYTVREARIHVRHVRDLLKSLDPSDAYNGVECNSLSFLNVVTQGDILEKKRSRPDSIDCTPSDYVLPNVKERLLLPLQPQNKEQKGPQCLKVLTTNGWNPPPGTRKMHGDLLYLSVITLEDRQFSITASTRGFYLNQSTAEEFNPKACVPNLLSHSLVDLLNQLSPAFKRNFALLQKKRTQRHPFERVATPYQVFTWTTPPVEHSIDAIRAEDAFSSKLGYEEHIPGQTRDWNEELQTTRELPRKTLPERLLRERAIFKVHSDFVAAATRGAMAVIDGNVMAINPGEESKMQMFIWNNIFFSLGFDVRNHYKELGGDAAAFAAPRNDLQGVRVYSAVDLEGLYTLGTVVVDYRGFRVTAQSIIPGILEREQEQSVVYGSIDFGKTVVTHPKYLELLGKAGSQLKILPHKVINDKDDEIELCSSVECKGIIGNDSRHYILDLLRTFPPDVNFLKLEDGDEIGEKTKALGLPIEHKHKLCCLRQELVDAFIESRYMMFIKFAAAQLQRLGITKQNKDVVDTQNESQVKSEEGEEKTTDKELMDSSSLCNGHDVVSVDDGLCKLDLSPNSKDSEAANSLENDKAKKMVESLTDGDKDNLEDSTKEIVRKAAVAVGSLKETEFDIRFNPDVYSPGVVHPHSKDERLKKERQLVKDAAEFLVFVQIPSFLRDCLDHSASPLDGATLAEALHNRGINIRYLGKITEMLAKVPQLEYVYSISVSELLTRSAKHLFMAYLQDVDMLNLAAAVSHFLNCFLSSCSLLQTQVAVDELSSKIVKKKNKKRTHPSKIVPGNEWENMSPRTLWNDIKSEVKAYYGWSIEVDNVDAAIKKYMLQKISLLRSFCMKVGIQLLLREYSFDNRQRQTFQEDDIINLFPLVKHINPRATDAYHFYTTGQTKIQQGYLKDGYELISEALNLLNNVYGAMHPEIAQCLRMLARLNYIMGDHAEAMAYQQKAVLMSERVNGIDHPYTITEYTHLALYCFSNAQVSTALKLLYRARYLALLVCGENHPEIALLDSNIGLVLHAVGEYELSLRFLEKALGLNMKYYGAKSLKVAVSYHLVARAQSCMGDFRSALHNEKETYTIYKQQLGEEHDKTKESSECLRHLTQQAVILQKKMNELSNGKISGVFPPLQIQPPSMGSVLDMLNIINGILFVQISQQDIEAFRMEFERSQRKLNEKGLDSSVSVLEKSRKTQESSSSNEKVESASR